MEMPLINLRAREISRNSSTKKEKLVQSVFSHARRHSWDKILQNSLSLAYVI